MTSVNLKSLLAKCNVYTTHVLTEAAGHAVNLTHYEVTLEHVVLAALEQDLQSDIPLLLQHFELNLGKLVHLLESALEDLKTGNSARPCFSPILLEILEEAWLIASVDLGLRQIRSGCILLAFLRNSTRYMQPALAQFFANLNGETILDNFANLVPSSVEQESFTQEAEPSDTQANATGTPFLDKYCEDLTAKARAQKIDPVFGRDLELRQIIDILARRRKNNPILVGEPGVGKTAVLEGLAIRIVEGEVPETLAKTTLLALDFGLLQAGASMKGEFERRLKGVLDEIKSSPTPIIVFIDEAHILVGTDSGAADLMKPALARGEMRTVAATTFKEYKKYFEKDAALARRFQKVQLDEPSVADTTYILQGLCAKYEAAHNVIIRAEALEAAAYLANRYITGRFLPDKAIDLIDTACARVKVNLAAQPKELETVEHHLRRTERELHLLQRDLAAGYSVNEEHVHELETNLANLKTNYETLAQKLKEQRTIIDRYLKEAKALNDTQEPSQDYLAAKAELDRLKTEQQLNFELEVTADVVAKVVSDWTGIPEGRMAIEQANLAMNLWDNLRKHVKGQDLSLHMIATGMQGALAGLKDPQQPLGVFLLVGPSGVGKTETALSLAEILFGDSKSVVTINMSEFQEKHSVARLIGSPPGYVGYGEGGLLTEAVRRRPYSLVLLDEVEKAHLDVLNLFYQVFDKGQLTDGEGTVVSFKNTIIILTSNLATDILQNLTAKDILQNLHKASNTQDEHNSAQLTTDELDPDSEQARKVMEQIINGIRPTLSKHFRPALLARMTIVPYLGLDDTTLSSICALKLQSLAKRLKENKGLTLTWQEPVLEQIIQLCKAVETGARNIDYILQGTVLPALAKNILAHMADQNLPTKVEIGIQDAQFLLNFS